MSEGRGLFIVLEGLDGSGTTTQTRRLGDEFARRGLPAFLTFEPTDGPIGKLIRDSLSGRLVLPETRHRITLSEGALCLLFGADRIEHSRVIDRVRNEGTHAISDRYLLSSIAYQSRDPDISPERVIEVNRGCAVPDVTLFLNVPVEQCLGRLDKRSDSPTVYEKQELLEAIERNYRATRPLYEKQFGPVVDIDGTLSENDVHKTIVASLEDYLPD